MVDLEGSTEKPQEVQGSQGKLAPYLAGLIEGDGTIAISQKDGSPVRAYNPKILIVFHLDDLPLAKRLKSVTSCGQIQIPYGRGYVLWAIQGIREVEKIALIINGYMRTPKIEALHRLINWLNEYRGKRLEKEIPLLGLDTSPINSNGWLAGFTDADGNFQVSITIRKKKGIAKGTRVQLFYRLEIRQTYHRDVTLELGGVSYFNILSKVSAYLGVNLLSRTRLINGKTYQSFMVIAFNPSSRKEVRNYFDKFPLFSSKLLNYLDWCKVDNLLISNSHLTPQGKELSLRIKSSMNRKRKQFDWTHLEELGP